MRRFYLKNGYADFHVISSEARYEPAEVGYILEIRVEEGPQYTISTVDVELHLPDIDPADAAAAGAVVAGRRL